MITPRIYAVLALASVIILAAAPCANASVLKLSRSDELKIGRDFYTNYGEDHKYLDYTAEGKHVRQVGERLVQRNGITDWDFTFTLVDDKEVNAFAVPGGYVFINKALYDYIAYDESMLAAVLGHEMTHVRERHYKKMYDKAVKTQVGVVIAGLVIGGDTGDQVAQVLGLGSSLVLLKYSRDEEEAADRGGIVLTYEAGYDPYGMARDMRLFQKLESRLGKDELFDLWRTHPQPKERITRCEEIAKELSGKDEKAYNPPSPPAGYDYGYANPELLPPAVVAATDGAYTDRIRITWKPSKGAASYKVYRASTEGGEYRQVGQSGSTSYDDFNVGEGVYWYRIQASNSYGDSELSVADRGYLKYGSQQPNPPGVLSPPTKVTASDGTHAGMVRIAWIASRGATNYKVFRATSQNGRYVYVGEATSSPYDDDVTKSNVFWYKVRAVNDTSISEFSNADSGYIRGGSQQPGPTDRIPNPPAGLIASDGTYEDAIRIVWDTSSGATSYKVYRSSSRLGAYSYIAQTRLPSYDDYDVDSGVYWYRVTAGNDMGDSDYSSADSGYIGGRQQIPAPPAKVAATDGDFADHIRINWTASDGASSYKVYRADSRDGNYIYVGQVSNLFFEDYAVDANVYWYKVRAVNVDGTSEFSPADSGYIQ